MKKTVMAVLLSALLIVSIAPAAFAQLGINTNTGISGNVETRTAGPVDSQTKTGASANVRTQTTIKTNYLGLKKDYDDRKERYEDSRDKYRSVTRIGVRLNETLRLQVTIEFLEAAAERIEAQLVRLKAVAEQNNRTEVAAKIQTHIDNVAEIKAKIESATTIEELKSIAAELRVEWKLAQQVVAKNHGLIFVQKIKNFIARIENLADKVDARVDKLEEDGYNVSSARAELNVTTSLIAQAKQKALDAEAEFKLVAGTPGQDSHFKKGHELLKEANDLLKEAHKNFVDFLKDVRKHIVRGENRGQIRGRANVSGEIEAEED